MFAQMKSIVLLKLIFYTNRVTSRGLILFIITYDVRDFGIVRLYC